MQVSGPLPSLLLLLAPVVWLAPDPVGADSGATATSVAPLVPADASAGGTLRVAVDAEPLGLDPRRDVLANSGGIIARAIFDPLAAYDEHGDVRPYLAESIRPDDDATRWTIRLRPGITFHDGAPLDAAALAAHFESARASPLNAELLDPLESVEVADELTVVLTMRSSWGSFAAHLTADAPTQLGFVLAPSMITDPEAGRHPVGAGPFELDSWRPDHSVTVRRNDDYWRHSPALESIEFRVITDSQVRTSALRSDEIDVMATTDGSIIADYTARSEAADGVVLLAPPADPDVMAINTTRPPLDDVDVRHALSLAIDRRRVAEVIQPHGTAEPVTGPYAPDSPWYHPTSWSEHDPGEAARLVADYEEEHGPIRITVIGVQTPVVLSHQQLLQSMWAEVGIDAELISAPQASVIASVLAGDFDLVGWGGFSSSDPDQDFDAFHSAGTGNITGYRDPQLDAALERGRASAVLDERRAAYATVQERLAAGMPYLWLTSNRWALVGGDGVRGLDDFTLPDGSPARPTSGPRCFLGQVWLDS